MINVHLIRKASSDEKDVLYPGYWLQGLTGSSRVFESDTFAAEYWAELETKVSSYTTSFAKGLLTDLNTFHSSSHSDRYWKIITLNWLSRFVRAVYYRYSLLLDIQKTHADCVFHILGSNTENLYCYLSRDIFDQCESEHWNNEVFKVILDELNFEYVIDAEILSNSNSELAKDHKNTNGLKDNLKLFLNYFNSVNKSHIRVTYLPQFKEVLLNVLNLQLPTFFIENQEQDLDCTIDMRKRSTYIGQSLSETDPFERIFKRLIPYCIPSLYLENFEKHKNYVLKNMKPSRPKFIFTSNSYDHDDSFKIYAAEKTEVGAKYFVGQHGNFLNTPLQEASFDIPELEYSDAYLTWGKVPQSKKTISAFPFTLLGKNKKPSSSRSSFEEVIVLMVPRKLNRYTWDVHREFRDYLNGLKRFHDLTLDIDKPFFLRPHNTFWSNPDIQNWVADNLSNFTVEDRKFGRVTDYDEKSLIVFTYDSTGITETLALNIPCLAFWNTERHIIYPHLQSIYQDLYENDVFFSSPEQISSYIRLKATNPSPDVAKREKAIESFLQYNANKDGMSLMKLNRILNG